MTEENNTPILNSSASNNNNNNNNNFQIPKSLVDIFKENNTLPFVSKRIDSNKSFENKPKNETTPLLLLLVLHNLDMKDIDKIIRGLQPNFQQLDIKLWIKETGYAHDNFKIQKKGNSILEDGKIILLPVIPNKIIHSNSKLYSFKHFCHGVNGCTIITPISRKNNPTLQINTPVNLNNETTEPPKKKGKPGRKKMEQKYKINKSQHCSFYIEFVQYYGHENAWYVYMGGSHGLLFKAGHSPLISDELKLTIIELDSHAGGATPGSITNMILNNKEIPIQEVPLMKQIEIFLRNTRQKEANYLSDPNAVRESLKKEEHKPFIMFPTLNEDIENTAKDGNNWIIVLATENSIKRLANLGKVVVGLDSCYKWTHQHLAIWPIIFTNELKRGEPGAIIISPSGKTEELYKGLKMAVTKVREIDNKWAPLFMIDKDAAERKAVLNLKDDFKDDFKVILCQFHIQETLHKEIGNQINYLIFKNQYYIIIIQYNMIQLN